MTLSTLTVLARRLHHHYSQPGADVSRIVTDLGQIVEGLEYLAGRIETPAQAAVDAGSTEMCDQCAAKLSQDIWKGMRAIPEDVKKEIFEDVRKMVRESTIAPGHNPDRLTVEQVGDGWRLLGVGDIEDETDQFWDIFESEWLPNAGWGARVVKDRSPYCVRRRIEPKQ